METKMQNKMILVTGSTDGIGKQTALELAGMGAEVILHGRSEQRCRAALDEILRATGNERLHFYAADFSSLRQVRELAAAVQRDHGRLDVLVNNAGVYMHERVLTEDGLEMTFAVNHLAHFLLTNLLLPVLKDSPAARIVTVASSAHEKRRVDFDNLQGEKHFDGFKAYLLSKLGNILFTYELAQRLQGSSVTANCLHPGVVDTKMQRMSFNLGGVSVAEGASTSVYLASSPEVEGVSGKYFVSKKAAESAPLTYDAEIRESFWRVSKQLAGLMPE
jgi:NAD(P)-dependent dehydrogenase (short-subunit alcohol dehydrogenase family)